MQTLLSRYYHKIKGSAEDIASDSFAYFLNESVESKNCFSNFIQRYTNVQLPSLTFNSQVTGDNKERPDISGLDPDYTEHITIEAKFWASLTENQPTTYLSRLQPNGVLVFICPSQRINSLSFELERRLKIGQIAVAEHMHDNLVKTYSVDTNKFLIITSWSYLLGIIRETLLQQNDHRLLSDIDQVIGLCERVDMDAMLPLRSEDLSPSLPRIIQGYYSIIDSVISELGNTGDVDIKGLKSTAQKYGYTKYFRTGALCGALEVHFQLWRYFGDTPIWLKFGIINQSGLWDMQNSEIKKACKAVALQENFNYVDSDDGAFHFAMFPKTGQTEDLVQQDLVSQFNHILKGIRSRLE